jgi:hypothetical protein
VAIVTAIPGMETVEDCDEKEGELDSNWLEVGLVVVL